MSKVIKTCIVFFCALFIFSEMKLACFAQSDITLSLPEGQHIVFKPIFLGLDANAIFASKKIKVGSHESNNDLPYKLQLTDILLSGSFVAESKIGKDWCYYIQETELQETQWNAVMRWWDKKQGVPPREATTSTLPKTKVTLAEIYTFIEALNAWLLAEQSQALPHYGKAKGFVRLPTEVEWEFAARGGLETFGKQSKGQSLFGRPYPYIDEDGTANINVFEWIRETSGNKVRECGSHHRKPNQLGLYDMLGNVEELTQSLFGPEYLQGRFGSYAVRGGNFSTSGKDCSVTIRTEYLSHNEDGEPHRSEKIGFRLALGSRISASGHLGTELDQDFNNYVQNRSLTRPGLSGQSSPAAQASQDLQAAQEAERKRLYEENDNLLKRVDAIQNDYANAVVSIKNLESMLASLNSSAPVSTPAPASAPASIPTPILTPPQTTDLQQEINNLQMQLAQEKQRNEDFRRERQAFTHEIAKNAQRVRFTEKRYLESLMRIANHNLFGAYGAMQKYKSAYEADLPKVARARKREAERFLQYYSDHIETMIDETDASLFPEVKKELQEWYYTKQGNKGMSLPLCSLNLLERYLNERRHGVSYEQDEFLDSLLNQKEFSQCK